MQVTRRAALKGLALFGAAIASRGRVSAESDPCTGLPSYNAQFDNPAWLGRTELDVPVFRTLEDRYASNMVRMLPYHSIIPIHQSLRGQPTAISPHNPIWFETDGGYVHSSFVVPCKEIFNEPEESIGAGFWGEITVPLTHQYWQPSLGAPYYNPLRWGTVYRVVDRNDDSCGQAWYRLQDDVYPHQNWWVLAAAVRRVRPNELAPISADVPPNNKRIEVNIADQTLRCFESDAEVFATRISSGGIYYAPEGAVYPFPTPWGDHYVQRKMPSRHMIGGHAINNPYDLPGVPWCTYFAATGEAIHGATTHNDFGHPRSHGCINVTPDAAKWIYRWTTPHTEYDNPAYWLDAKDRALATTVRVGNIKPKGASQ